MSLGQDGKGVTEVTPSGSSYLERTLYTFFSLITRPWSAPELWSLGILVCLTHCCMSVKGHHDHKTLVKESV